MTLTQENNSYTLTDSLIGLFKDVYNSEQIEEIKIKLDQYIQTLKELDKQNPIITAHTLHTVIDTKISENRRRKPEIAHDISCKKGCSHCCYQQVLINLSEAKLIIQYAVSRKIEIDLEKLLHQMALSKSSWRLQRKELKSCLFLDKDQGCRIYEVRPNSCRKLLSLDDPQKCIEPAVSFPKMFVMPEVEIITSAADSCMLSGDLPSMLIKAIDELKKDNSPQS